MARVNPLAMFYRDELRNHAKWIAARWDKPPVRGWKAVRRLFIAPRWNWETGAQEGHKPGELIEFLTRPSMGEWADIGYYVAQMHPLVWKIYVLVSPVDAIWEAVDKYRKRASGR